MKKTVCILLGLILTGSLLLVGCERNKGEEIPLEERIMIDAWNRAIEKDYSLTALEEFSKKYGQQENFEDFIINSFEELDEEKVLKITASFAVKNDQNFNTEKILAYIQDRVNFSEKTFQEKVEYLFFLEENFYLTTNYVKFTITEQELKDSILSVESEPVYCEKNQGFYADETDYQHRKLPAEGMYTIRYEDAEFFGDFKYVKHYGERLDDHYQRHSFSSSSWHFKDHAYDGGKPWGNERLIDTYLIQHNEKERYIKIYDIAQEKTVLKPITIFYNS